MPPEKVEELDVPMYSSGQLTRMVEESFSRQFPRQENEAYRFIRDMYLGHPRFGNSAVIHSGANFYLAEMDLAGDVPVFAPQDQWEEVRKTYEPVETEAATAEGEDIEEMETFTESAQIISLREAEGAGRRDPLTIRFVMIEPGWGNKRDNHYYSKSVLREGAPKFVGAKMYVTDHRPEQRNALTEVAEIDDIVGYTDTGGPIAEATVWGPDFAEQVRNRAKVDKLHTLECSILGRGSAKRGMAEGRKGKLIQEISEGRAVDWVSRAGAGGHALDISESEPTDSGGKQMDEKDKAQQEPVEETQIDESAAETEVQIQESNDTPTKDPPQETTEVITQEAALSQEEVSTLLSESGLGKQAQGFLESRPFADEAEAKAAVQEMKAFVKEMTGAGQPFAQGAQTVKVEEKTDDQFWAELKEKYSLDLPVEEKS